MNICPTWCRLWLLLLSIAILSDAADALSSTTFISNNPTPLIHPRTIMSASSLKGDDDGVLEEVMEPVKFEPSSPSSKQQPQAQERRRRRGRPGIVVFSGGTAFNAAAAEMASRNVVSATTFGESSGSGLDDSVISNISQSNSVDEMMMKSMMTSLPNNSNNNIEAGGGIKVWHVLPVTDDGGSTAEIVRVLGGPAVGDIRSRLLRLAPGNTRESVAVRRLLGHRLVSASTSDEEEGDMADKVSRMAREEWLDIIDGGLESNHRYNGLRNHATDDEDNDEEEELIEHPLWRGVSTPYRSIIRSFLVHFHTQVMQTHNGIRHSSSHPPFDFTGGSVGNFFFAGARIFFGSLPAAIFLFSKVAGIPSGSRVLPAILSEERLVLGAVLKDGTRLRGQYEISHPSQRHLATSPRRDRSDSFKAVVKSFDTSVSLQDGITSLHPSEISRVSYLLHDPTWRRKDNEQSLPHNVYPNSPTRSKNRIRRDWTDRHEVDPDPNPLVLEAISNANCVVYGCGSLFTSVLPSLVLRGVGGEIKKRTVPKVLLLNGWHDHETMFIETSRDGDTAVKSMDATSIVQAVVHAFDRGRISAGVYSKSQFSYDSAEQLNNDDENSSDDGRALEPIPLITDYITRIFYPIGTEIEIDEQSLHELCVSRHSASAGIADHLNNKFIESNRDNISVIGIPSIPADQCVEGKRSGGRNDHRIFDAGKLVDALLDLAST
jgi:2-phospho-L-lactate transferase/gluconeogenesis factor (CofD/UPF0052 family)